MNESEVMLTTLAAFPEFKMRQLGRVSARVKRPRNTFAEVLRGIRAFIAGPSFEFLSESERARRESLTLLRTQAQERGANGVIGLRFRAAEARDGSTHVFALGRAVVLDLTK